MNDDFFFPYEKAKRWSKKLALHAVSHFLLCASHYALLPALPLWMVRN